MLLLILIVALITGITLGFIFERSQFCTVRILNNAFSLKVYEGLAGLIVLILVSVILLNFILFSGMVTKFNLLHFIDMSPTAICAPPFVPLSNFIGAFLFGVGMVFAGMCVTGMLFRMGEGYLSSLVTLLGIAVGFGIIPVFKGVKIILPKFFTGITYTLCPPGVMAYDFLGMNPIILIVTFSAICIALLLAIKIRLSTH